ncbi:MAG TPA: M1 family metallopeptidase [Polyangiaceae bacterium]|nr:M1 family metallopeptidase [Polyangiaceae bacterium]
MSRLMAMHVRWPYCWVLVPLSLAIESRAVAADSALSCVGQDSPIGAPRSVASYRIAAALSPDEHVVSGQTRINWVNPSRTPTNELYIHAYMNAFSQPKSRFLRAPTGSRSAFSMPSAYGSIRITRLVAVDRSELDLLPALEKHTSGDPDDATDLRLALPFEISPGESLQLEIGFVTRLPGLIERAGFSGSFHAVTQWFPKIALLDQTGIWRHFPYEPLAEFSSDFGDYDVTLEAPEGFVIAAPGQRTLRNTENGRQREHYCANGVHDFAWFAWDQFVESVERSGSVEIRHYAPPGQTENSRRTADAIRFGLEYYGTQFFPYPYRNLTVVHPPDNARAAGGMEYPQLITTGGPWYLPYLGLRAVEAVTLHELAHQWFYGIIASDEFLEPVLDEGLASWAEVDALTARFGASSMIGAGWVTVSESGIRRELARAYTRCGPLDLRASGFGSFGAIAGRVYARFPTLLETIARVYGRAPLERALRAYAVRHRFKHPVGSDFLQAMHEHLPPTASRALSTALLEDAWVDYAVREISSPLVSGTGLFANRIRLERRGTLTFPTTLEVEFSDGNTVRRHVDAVESTTWLEWPHRVPVVRATIDPDHLITIDDDLGNQTLRINGVLPRGRLATALQVALSTLWALGWP